MAKKQKPITGLMRTQDVADFLAVSRSQIYRLMYRGELPHVKICETNRVPVKAVLDYCEANYHKQLFPTKDKEHGSKEG